MTTDILKEILVCISCERNYKLVAPELAFYQRLHLPVPKQCFQCRHLDRLRRRGSYTLHQLTCDRCSATISTTYAPDSPFPVWCEACFIAQFV